MKQLRLLLLMLVACLAQVSMAQSTVDKLKREMQEREWHNEAVANFDKGLVVILMCSKDNDDVQRYINLLVKQDISEYFKYDERVSHTKDWLNNIRWKLPKWDEKLSKGKKIKSEDAIKAAVAYASGYNDICQVDYAKAEKYFKLVDVNIYKKNEIDLCILGCQYMANKDKAMATAGMTFDEPTDELSSIAEKYGMEDIYDAKLQQLVQTQQQAIKRAIRSQDKEALEKLKPYQVPQVDSLLATYGDEECIDRCLLKHKMLSFIGEVMFRYGDMEFILNYPYWVVKEGFKDKGFQNKLFKSIEKRYFSTCQYGRNGGDYLIFNSYTYNSTKDLSPKQFMDKEDLPKVLNKLAKENELASYFLTITTLYFAQKTYSSMGKDGDKCIWYEGYTKMEIDASKAKGVLTYLNNILVNLIKKNPSLKNYGNYSKTFEIEDDGWVNFFNVPNNDFSPIYSSFMKELCDK